MSGSATAICSGGCLSVLLDPYRGEGFHRIRHYGLFASAERRHNIAQLRQLLAVPAPKPEVDDVEDKAAASKPLAPACPCCGGRMVIIETFERGATPRHRPTTPIRRLRIDTS